jgi:8-oxo-dGTP diphosphatase
MTEIRQRVVCYITRGKRELLVFEHEPQYGDAGVQVVAGGIDEGETPAEAASRETLEEAGLKLENPVFLGSMDKFWPGPTNPNQHWHFFWLEAPTETPDSWTHEVSGGADDSGMLFTQRFVKLEEVKLDWDMDAMLPVLKKRMAARERVVCYITRGRNELLVFEHNDPQLMAGTQVVAGGIDDGETIEQAATREVFEEAGLTLENGVHLGSELIQPPVGREWKMNPQLWHYFLFEANEETRDSWDHVVSAGNEAGQVYQQLFVKLEGVSLEFGLEKMLEKLKKELL